jgi:hypothetical protein
LISLKPVPGGLTVFETDREVLAWYERQTRALTKEFLDSIPWNDVGNYEIKPAFIPVLFYMRDVEYFTEMYYREVKRTPTGRDPVIRKFMDKWSVEEDEHGGTINRFIEAAGLPTSEKWRAEAKAKIPWHYAVGSFFADYACNPFGKYFHAAHMVWGTINEITTLQGYRRMAELAGHPVLKKVLTAVMHEEAIHSNFYWNMARVKLSQAKFSRDLARFIIRRYWTPVGQGAKPEHYTNYIISTLFSGPGGLDVFRRTVSDRVTRLPGFAGFTGLIDRLAPIVQS